MTPEELEQVTIRALYDAHALHERMGAEGTKPVQTNRFGETAVALDVAAEEVVLSAFEAARVPIQFVTEEHGELSLGTAPTLLGVIDGIDGSSVYLAARGTGRYGTMVASFTGLTPRYEDYLVCGIMLHSPHPQLILARHGMGCFVVEANERRILHCSSTTSLARVTALAYDDYFAINRTTFAEKLSDYPLHCDHSSAVHFADLVGGAVDAVLECTRKQNLEFAVAYGIIAEAGGVMVTLSGKNLGDQLFRVFSPSIHTPVVAAATQTLATAILQRVT